MGRPESKVKLGMLSAMTLFGTDCELHTMKELNAW